MEETTDLKSVQVLVRPQRRILFFIKTNDMRLKKLIFCLVLVSLVAYSSPVMKVMPVNTPSVKEEAEEKSDIDYDRICFIESRNQDSAVSCEGAIGIMQIMPVSLKEWNLHHPEQMYAEEDLYNRKINRKIGVWLLSKRLPQYLHAEKIPPKVSHRLIAYNWGVGNFIRWYHKGANYDSLPRQTKDYLIKYRN